MAKRSWASVALLLLTACQTVPKPPANLSDTSTEAYLVLMDQLGELMRAPPSRSSTYCVAVYTPDDPESLRPDPALITHLQRAALDAYDIRLIPGRDCSAAVASDPPPTGPVYPDLYAVNQDQDAERPWKAGYGCGTLCGHGSFYVIDLNTGTPVAKQVGTFIN